MKEKIEEVVNLYENKLTQLSTLLDGIKEEFSALKEDNAVPEENRNKILDILERIVSVEKDLISVSKEVENLNSNVSNLEATLKKLDTSYQELAGSINQIRLKISELEKLHEDISEKKKKWFDIFLQIVLPIIGAGLLFFITLSLKSCSSFFEPTYKTPSKSQYINFEEKN